ncbi:ComEC/Rec2 family competence protein [Cognatishimia sp. F0-27]|uniref:ComEC/Rec2 family competence protein n=1 Tax=Cognatishimia sp. F0-27 TaxID=2816855 RepID=UPI001D0CA580|nr:ComEC/Rec2 family competence protein [Cognatishimia sp. F0-27]MCC1493305.1 ComEC/Rec2 family competence protein [Cognatishimia sp. F0-27]
MAPVLTRLEHMLLGQRGHLFPWAPVALACGIGFYFSLRFEPPLWALWGLVVLGLGGVTGPRVAGAVWGVLIAGLALVLLGIGLAGLRAHSVAGPVLDFRYYGSIEGRVVGVDRSASDAVRVTLDRVVLERMDPRDTPQRVRISLHGQQGFAEPSPGAVILTTGHLSQPGGAVEPGGFDFRRHAWFLRLGAVGYTRNPVVLLEPPGNGLSVFKARMWLSARVQTALPGDSGAFAAAVMSGDRSGMGQDTLQALRDTNLAHLLAISGLHMGLLAGFVFAALRLALLIIPATRHRWPVKKIAAAGALLAAFGYLLLSGGNVATERAFIMAATALCALMLDRRAISLRAVAMAALIVLVWQPEALLGPGFQMSFAATTALVAVFEQLTHVQREHPLPRWAIPVFSLFVSSAVAGFATAPVGMAHFNQIAHYGLIANLVSVPVMGILVVPMAVVAALAMPFGLDWIPLWVMGLGLDWILFVADQVAAWEGATRAIKAPQAGVLALLALGGLILCLWRGAGRLVGIGPLLLATLLWAQTQRPALLIANTGGLVGVLTEHGRALSKARGAGFVAEIWLENDGHGMSQEEAAALWPEPDAARTARYTLSGTEVVHLQGKRAIRAWTECDAGQIIVASSEAALEGDCVLLDPARLRHTGAIALFAEDRGYRMVQAAHRTGLRLWAGVYPNKHSAGLPEQGLLIARRAP